MKLELLNFYFEKNGYKRNANKSYFNYIRKDYEIKISKIEKKAFILKGSNVIFETGLPTKEASIVKWCNILIDKDENKNNQIDSEY